MIIAGLFVILVLALFITIRQIQQSLFSTFYRITGSTTGAVWFSSLVYLPGTFIHELSHLVFAIATLHEVVAFNLIPHTKQRGEKMEIHMGSITYYPKDPLRGFIVGVAPFLVGIVSLYILFITRPYVVGDWWSMALWAYGVFVIASTMFTSPSDLKDVPIVTLFIAAIALAMYFLVPETFVIIGSWISESPLIPFVAQVNWYLSFALGGNILLYICLQSLIRVYESLRSRG